MWPIGIHKRKGKWDGRRQRWKSTRLLKGKSNHRRHESIMWTWGTTETKNGRMLTGELNGEDGVQKEKLKTLN